MRRFIAVQYGKRKYPPGITPRLLELAGHFDAKAASVEGPYWLHTEYAYGPRKFSSPALAAAPSIPYAQRGGIPQLWHSEAWAMDLAAFISKLLEGLPPPTVIEVHPPFRDCCPTIQGFLDRYEVFEDAVRGAYPGAELLLENRCGSMSRGGGFLVSTAADVVGLMGEIAARGLELRLALDVPQAFSAAGDVEQLSCEEIERILSDLMPARHMVRSIHLWGKKRNASGQRIAHHGSLDDYFEGVDRKKRAFLRGFARLLDDGRERYFVPAVNSGDADLAKLVDDMVAAGCVFV